MSANWSIVERTKRFALRIIRLYSSLPKSTEAQVIGKQMLRSGTSVGAHIREGKRSRSDAEMISKIEVAQQELEETLYWLELLIGSNLVKRERLDDLMEEANELIAILVTSSKTIKHRKKATTKSESEAVNNSV
ncbi:MULTISPECIES: four helix bundle protein [unclassified Microbulbifer]|uniref:four helix bundle protein n=1 Tax=unclassified Microbulbifer TaxID=2619833 RepID=UPI0027E5AEFB|nr:MULTISPECIES: four helix bundle protein [unclassified Microbulbifer]